MPMLSRRLERKWVQNSKNFYGPRWNKRKLEEVANGNSNNELE